jgi:putative methanogenesis marker protein 6
MIVRETRLIVISPASEITPDQLTRTIHAMGKSVTVKESCYGAVIEGERSIVREVVGEVRKTDPNGIFSKVRAFRVADPRRCRAHHGSRPGFAQLEQEWEDLWKIHRGLERCEKGEKASPAGTKEKLPVEDFKRICEVKR